ncbi:unnamed protein product [Paramecium sonneborni]|uniref:Uncharacterized protein n=1 Tax=Paramecium sonneborni TaxID=65129 RepID=A0A8S1JYG8_9CILI|nr:unnamed protein product [Paramecium sonneborni]
MGLSSNKSEPLNHVKQIARLLDINNPRNVNHQYANNIIIILNQYTGTGIKLTHQYSSNLSKSEWDQIQKAFGIVIKKLLSGRSLGRFFLPIINV